MMNNGASWAKRVAVAGVAGIALYFLGPRIYESIVPAPELRIWWPVTPPYVDWQKSAIIGNGSAVSKSPGFFDRLEVQLTDDANISIEAKTTVKYNGRYEAFFSYTAPLPKEVVPGTRLTIRATLLFRKRTGEESTRKLPDLTYVVPDRPK
ncbi:MAG: hypothetical protein ACRC1K_16945 [Planctomycetia bacterium]